MWVPRVGPRTVGPRRVGARRVEPRRVEPRRVVPRRVGPRRVGRRVGPKFRAFFSLSRRKIRSFLSSLEVFSGILVVFEAPGRSNVHVWSSRAVVCEPGRPGLVGPPGFHTTAREPKRAHLRVPVFKNTTKIQRENTQRGKKRTNFAAGEGEKRAKFWAVPGRAVPGRAVPGTPNMFFFF